MGPFHVKLCGEKQKVWILVITCLWSRAINLKICRSLDVSDFLRGLQLHIYEFGMFQRCISDLGSQLVAGSKIISEFIGDSQTKQFFNENGIDGVSFEHFCKGNSALGGLVETCVKSCKRLLYKSIKNNVLDFFDFEFVVVKVVHLVNRRPIAFKAALRDTSVNDRVPDAITPECLVRGYNLLSLNVVPFLQSKPDDEDFVHDETHLDLIRNRYSKLARVRQNVIDLYHDEFLVQLIEQATDQKDRFKRITHVPLKKGDIVLLKDQFAKPSSYPLGIVEKVDVNSLGEVTAATVFKGSTRERVYRHSSSLILLIPALNDDNSSDSDENLSTDNPSSAGDDVTRVRQKRAAVVRGETRTKNLIAHNLV